MWIFIFHIAGKAFTKPDFTSDVIIVYVLNASAAGRYGNHHRAMYQKFGKQFDNAACPMPDSIDPYIFKRFGVGISVCDGFADTLTVIGRQRPKGFINR